MQCSIYKKLLLYLIQIITVSVAKYQWSS